MAKYAAWIGTSRCVDATSALTVKMPSAGGVSQGHLAPLMRPTKFPEIPVSLERNTEVFRHPLLGALSPLLIWTGGSTPLLCLEGVPDLPVAPQDEAGLTKTFQTWPRGWFHIP